MRGIVKGGLNDGGSNIKSIQTGETLMSTSTTKNITISAVDLSKTIVKITINSGQDNAAQNTCISSELTTATNLQLVRYVNTYGAVTVAYEIIEFNNIKSKQTGDVSMSVSPTNVTISSIDISKSLLFFSYKMNVASSDIRYAYLQGRITSNTNIEFKHSYYTGQQIKWQIIEFN